MGAPQTPKEHLIHFVTKVKQDEEYKFTVRGNEQDARNYVHRMRVELSRMRDAVRQRGRVPKAFKVYLRSVETSPDFKVSEIIICRVKSPNDLTDEVAEIFGALDGGQILDV